MTRLVIATVCFAAAIGVCGWTWHLGSRARTAWDFSANCGCWMLLAVAGLLVKTARRAVHRRGPSPAHPAWAARGRTASQQELTPDLRAWAAEVAEECPDVTVLVRCL